MTTAILGHMDNLDTIRGVAHGAKRLLFVAGAAVLIVLAGTGTAVFLIVKTL